MKGQSIILDSSIVEATNADQVTVAAFLPGLMVSVTTTNTMDADHSQAGKNAISVTNGTSEVSLN
jgi:hypothetical protein